MSLDDLLATTAGASAQVKTDESSIHGCVVIQPVVIGGYECCTANYFTRGVITQASIVVTEDTAKRLSFVTGYTSTSDGPEVKVLEEMLLTRYPEEIFAAEDLRDWDEWVEFFGRTRELDGRRKGLVEIEHDCQSSRIRDGGTRTARSRKTFRTSPGITPDWLEGIHEGRNSQDDCPPS